MSVTVGPAVDHDGIAVALYRADETRHQTPLVPFMAGRSSELQEHRRVLPVAISVSFTGDQLIVTRGPGVTSFKFPKPIGPLPARSAPAGPARCWGIVLAVTASQESVNRYVEKL